MLLRMKAPFFWLYLMTWCESASCHSMLIAYLPHRNKQRRRIFRVGVLPGFVRLTTRTPHGVHAGARGGKRNRIDPHRVGLNGSRCVRVGLADALAHQEQASEALQVNELALRVVAREAAVVPAWAWRTGGRGSC